MVRQCSPAGVSKARDLFESALTAAGLHVAQGSKIWEAYRQYEQAILLTFDETDIEVRIFSKALPEIYLDHAIQLLPILVGFYMNFTGKDNGFIL